MPGQWSGVDWGKPGPSYTKASASSNSRLCKYGCSKDEIVCIEEENNFYQLKFSSLWRNAILMVQKMETNNVGYWKCACSCSVVIWCVHLYIKIVKNLWWHLSFSHRPTLFKALKYFPPIKGIPGNACSKKITFSIIRYSFGIDRPR